MSKPTMATVKSFVRKNQGRLYIRYHSAFDGMVDAVRYHEGPREFHLTQPGEHVSNSLGIQGAWFVGSSRDYLTPLAENGFSGFHVSNCCGSFDLAVKAA